MNLVGDLITEKRSEDKSMPSPNPDPPCIPLMEISNQQTVGLDRVSRLEADLANIANCSLKCIDSSLCLKHASQVDEEISDGGVDSGDNLFEDSESPDTKMKVDKGGDVPFPS